MKPFPLLLWIVSSALLIIVHIVYSPGLQAFYASHPILHFFSILYLILFLVVTYIFFSIFDIKRKKKLKSFEKVCDFISKYFLGIFALFSAYFLLAGSIIPGAGHPRIYSTLWYLLLSIFILLVGLIPTSRFFLINKNTIWPKLYLILIIWIFGWGFSGLTGVINGGFLKIPLVWDTWVFTITSLLELAAILVYTLYFFNIKLFK